MEHGMSAVISSLQSLCY